MKTIPTQISVSLLTFLAASLATTTLEAAQPQSSGSTTEAALVTLSVEDQDGKRTLTTIPDQGLVTLSIVDASQPSLLGLSPRVVGGEVELTIYLAQETTDTVQQLDRVQLSLGEPELVTVLDQSLIVEASLEASAATPLIASSPNSSTSLCSPNGAQAEAFFFSPSASATCCTMCAGDTVCACRVSDDCGNSCCAGICC